MTSVKLINHSSSTADWNYYRIFVPQLSPSEASGDKILYLDIFWTHTTSKL